MTEQAVFSLDMILEDGRFGWQVKRPKPEVEVVETKTIKLCADCGEPFERRKQIKFCLQCSKKRFKAYQQKLRIKYRLKARQCGYITLRNGQPYYYDKCDRCKTVLIQPITTRGFLYCQPCGKQIMRQRQAIWERTHPNGANRK